MIQIAVVDNDENILEMIDKYIQQEIEGQDQIRVLTFANAKELLLYLEENQKIEIVISDVSMPEMDGLALGKILNAKYPWIYIVYLTSYSEYAAESYVIEAYQYILKSDIEERFRVILRKLLRQVERETQQFRLVGTIGDQGLILYRDILYIEKSKSAKYVKYITRDGEYRERITLNKLKEELKSDDFIQVERGFIVNINHIARLSGVIICMDNGDEIVVSRARLKTVKEQITRYWGNLP